MLNLSIDGPVARVEIDNPPVNAFSFAMAGLLSDTLQAAGRAEVAVLVLTAAGRRAFCAGMDLRERLEIGSEEHLRRTREVRAAVSALREFRAPTLCSINGPAVGLGVALAVACDLRICSADASFSMPEIDRGTVADGGLSLREIGMPAGVVRSMLFTGRSLSATEASAAHLVDDVVGADQLEQRTAVLIAKLADRPVARLWSMKAAVRAADGAWIGSRPAAEAISAIGAEVARRPDSVESVRHYLAGSTPNQSE